MEMSSDVAGEGDTGGGGGWGGAGAPGAHSKRSSRALIYTGDLGR